MISETVASAGGRDAAMAGIGGFNSGALLQGAAAEEDAAAEAPPATVTVPKVERAGVGRII